MVTLRYVSIGINYSGNVQRGTSLFEVGEKSNTKVDINTPTTQRPLRLSASIMGQALAVRTG